MLQNVFFQQLWICLAGFLAGLSSRVWLAALLAAALTPYGSDNGVSLLLEIPSAVLTKLRLKIVCAVTPNIWSSELCLIPIVIYV